MEKGPDNRRQLDYIDGVSYDLGKMTLQEVRDVERECRQRVIDAEAEHAVVLDYLDRRWPDGEPA